MFHNYLFKLNAAVADGLQSIQVMKSISVRSQQYEQSARLRDAEKLFDQLKHQLTGYSHPFPIGGLKPGGNLYYKHLFTYAAADNWDIADSISTQFQTRKNKQDIEQRLTENDTLHLIELNKKLTDKENELIEFVNFMSFKIVVKNLDNVNAEGGNVSLRCYTGNTRSALLTYNSTGQSPFYQLRLSTRKLLSSGPEYYQTGLYLNTPDNVFLEPFPLKLRDEKLCYLFYLLTQTGLLALTDLLNITDVDIAWDVRYLIGPDNGDEVMAGI